MKDIKNKTKQELQSLLAEKREALRVMRFGVANSTSKDVKARGVIRKEVAQILTMLHTAVSK